MLKSPPTIELHELHRRRHYEDPHKSHLFVGKSPPLMSHRFLWQHWSHGLASLKWAENIVVKPSVATSLEMTKQPLPPPSSWTQMCQSIPAAKKYTIDWVTYTINIYFSQFWELSIVQSRCWQMPYLVTALFMVLSLCPYTVEEVTGPSKGPYIRALKPFLRSPPSWPHHLPRCPISKYHHIKD